MNSPFCRSIETKMTNGFSKEKKVASKVTGGSMILSYNEYKQRKAWIITYQHSSNLFMYFTVP